MKNKSYNVIVKFMREPEDIIASCTCPWTKYQLTATGFEPRTT